MARKQTAGERFESEDGAKKTPLKTAAEIAALEKAVAAEKFPTDLKEAFALLAKANSTPVNTQAEWEESQPRIKALKLHIHKLQQGLPELDTKSGDLNHAHLAAVTNEMKRVALARTNPAVADLVAELKASNKSNVELKAALESALNELAALKNPPAAQSVNNFTVNRKTI